MENKDIISIINQKSETELIKMGEFVPINLKHYLQTQIPWLQDEEYFLGHKLDRKPLSKDLAEEVLSTQHSLRFRAYYSLKYPDQVQSFE